MLLKGFNLRTLYLKLSKYLNSVYEKNYGTLWYVKYQIVHSLDLCVLISFIFFVGVQLVVMPIYSALFFYMLINNSYRVYNYAYSPQQIEVACGDHFKHFHSASLEFIYNITFRRAYVNSFTLVYKTLKFYNNYSLGNSNLSKKTTIVIKIILHFIVFIIWNMILGVPWFIVCRSFQYSKAFRSWRWSTYQRYTLRGKVINNYQVRELDPGLFYRIYRTNNSIWNFNPNYFSKNSNLLAEKLIKDGRIWCLYGLLLDEMTVLHIKLPGMRTSHLSGYINGLWYNNLPCCCSTNLTSNPNYNSNIRYSGTLTKKNPQNQTNLELWYEHLMSIDLKQNPSGFQVTVKKLYLSQWAFTFSTVFNSGGASNLNLQPLFSHLAAEGFEFNSEISTTLLEAGNYTNDLQQFIVKHRLTELDLAVAKDSTLSILCPQISDDVDWFEFSSKPNKSLAAPDVVSDSFI